MTWRIQAYDMSCFAKSTVYEKNRMSSWTIWDLIGIWDPSQDKIGAKFCFDLLFGQVQDRQILACPVSLPTLANPNSSIDKISLTRFGFDFIQKLGICVCFSHPSDLLHLHSRISSIYIHCSLVLHIFQMPKPSIKFEILFIICTVRPTVIKKKKNEK